MDFFEEDRLYTLLKWIRRKPYSTLNALAEKLGVSERTVRNDIKELEDTLEGTAVIENLQGCYKLFITNEEAYDTIVAKMKGGGECFYSPQKRMAFIIQKLMRSDEPCFIDDLADDMNIGRTTLVQDMKKIKEKLSLYGLSIEGKPKMGIALKGSEIGLRRLILENVYDLIYENYDAFLEKEILNGVRTVLENYRYESDTISAVLRSFTLLADRFLTGHPLEQMEEKYYFITDSSPYGVAEEVAAVLERGFQTKLPVEEKIFLSLPIAGMRTPTNISDMLTKRVSDDIRDTLLRIMARIRYELGLYITSQDMNGEFAYHVMFMLNRLRYGIKLKMPISEQVQEKYPLAYKMARIAGNVIQEIWGYTVPEEELGYLASYFGVFILEKGLETQQLSRVAVICGTGRGTARLVMAQLRKILSKDTVFDLYADNKINPAMMEHYDLIFTTVRLPYETDPPAIFLHEIFDEKEMKAKIEAVRHRKSFQEAGVAIGDSLIARLLDETLFYVLDSDKTYMENVEYIIDDMTEKKLVDIGFKERVRKREKAGTMVFDKHIALPHTINEGSDKFVMALGVLPKEEGPDDGIRLLFLLGLPQTEDLDDTVLLNLYDEIIAIAQDEEAVEEISQIKSYKELVKYLLRKQSFFH